MPDLGSNKKLFLILLILLSVWSCAPEPLKTHLLLSVEFANVPEGMIVTQYHTDKIEIHIQGDPRLIEAFTENRFFTRQIYTRTWTLIPPELPSPSGRILHAAGG